ncbi:MAG: cysteine desulfurase [Candidatus Tokpelaia sp. JSC188]|nr:MAG: cysteine desulfurase [Candidatus Tokpelaia sp. JSC188]
MKRIYLDYNSTTPLSVRVYNSLFETFNTLGNPSSIHNEGRIAKSILEKARCALARLIHSDSGRIVFTSGATEAAMTLLTPYYFIERSPLFMSHLYFSATEHPCIASKGRFSEGMSTVIPVDNDGIVQPDVLRSLLAKHNKRKGLPLVAIQYANHETGVVQPIEILGPIVKEAGGFFIIDAVQALAKEKLNVTHTCGDFFIFSAHKIGGPKGIGAFAFSNDLIMPQPLITGGGQERGFRAGTESLPLIAGFGAAAIDAKEYLQKQNHLAELQKKLEDGIKKIRDSIIIYGSKSRRLVNTTFFSVPGFKAETMQIAFDLEGIAVSAGAACSSGKTEISPVLQAMGVSDSNGAIRVSVGWETHGHDIEYFLTVFQKIMSRKNNQLKFRSSKHTHNT